MYIYSIYIYINIYIYIFIYLYIYIIIYTHNLNIDTLELLELLKLQVSKWDWGLWGLTWGSMNRFVMNSLEIPLVYHPSPHLGNWQIWIDPTSKQLHQLPVPTCRCVLRTTGNSHLFLKYVLRSLVWQPGHDEKKWRNQDCWSHSRRNGPPSDREVGLQLW